MVTWNLISTRAPKFAVASPIPNPNISTKLKQNISSGSLRIFLKKVKTPIFIKANNKNSIKKVLSKAASTINGFLASQINGLNIPETIAIGAFSSTPNGVDSKSPIS